MKKTFIKSLAGKVFPVFLEKDEDGVYVAECPLFRGCYTQGKTLAEALKHIKEVISLCLEEKDNRVRAKSYKSRLTMLEMVSL